jgi:hypothetical protein
MKHGAYLLLVVLGLWGLLALANDRPQEVWRCGSMFTNQPLPDQSCESVTRSTLEDIQVPQPLRRHTPSSAAPAPASKSAAVRVDATAQRERDSQAKDILNHELKRLNLRCQAVTDTQTVQRCAADQAALKRELSRLP